MYVQKAKFDTKSAQNGLATETMEQFMYTYLVHKYGLKSLIVEWATAIINGVRAHMLVDHEICLFAKVLKNECDEDFRLIQHHVRSSVLSVLKIVLREKYPLKSEADISRQVTRITKSTGTSVMEEGIWRRIITKMYDKRDCANIIHKLNILLGQKQEAKENDLGWSSHN